MDVLLKVEFCQYLLYFVGKFVSVLEPLKKSCTNHPNVDIRIFGKRWSLILGCFFPVSILNELICA